MNWKDDLEQKVKELGDTLIECTSTDEEMKRKFDGGYGGEEGSPFTAWGEKYVYFPICYDGSEWIGHAPRNPCAERMPHQGG